MTEEKTPISASITNLLAQAPSAIALASAYAFFLVVVYQVMYFTAAGIPEALALLTITDYINRAVWVVVTCVIVAGPVSAGFAQVITNVFSSTFEKSRKGLAILGILLILVSIVGAIIIDRTEQDWSIEKIDGLASMVALLLMGILFSSLIAEPSKTVLAGIFAFIVGIFVITIAAKAGATAGARERHCPTPVIVEFPDHTKLAAEMVSILDGGLSVRPATRDSITIIPWGSQSRFTVSHCKPKK